MKRMKTLKPGKWLRHYDSHVYFIEDGGPIVNSSGVHTRKWTVIIYYRDDSFELLDFYQAKRGKEWGPYIPTPKDFQSAIKAAFGEMR